MQIKVGFGFDVHQLKEASDFWLGGVKIPHHKGAFGHSDADVLIHAICDALLGAANLGDIGIHFPNTSAEYKGIDSKILLKKVADLLSANGFRIGNIDSTICLESPKISPYIPLMSKALSLSMGISPSDVSIKATTTETLGFVGREEGISAYAVVLIEKIH
jgi:2-C-methyl-D-erythritol 2,4-cyclodiphosphate synthase